ncbi:MAG TPA: hypothetical protein VD994_20940, partial [Prosthecobacter sp.]|nr:hypothetical protein [Prosthecobacter sp.]
QTLLQRFRADKNHTEILTPPVPHPAGFDRTQEHELLVTVFGEQIRIWLDGRWVSEGLDKWGKDGAARIMFHTNSVVRSVEVAGLRRETVEIEKLTSNLAGRVVDLLALIDVDRDTIRGMWSKSTRGVSVAPQSGVTVLEIPYQPPEEYDYEVEFTPDNDGMNVNQYLSAGGRSFAWKLNSHNIVPPLYGFEMLDGRFAKDLREAATQMDSAIEKGKRYHSKIEVRRGGLRALLDGEELVRWSGDFNRFSMEDHSRLRDELHLGIGSWKRAVTFHKVQVTEVTGTGRVDSGTPQAANWRDWFGPWFSKWTFNGTGWIKEAEGVTTDQQFRGEVVLPATTRDGAVRLGYTMRNSEGASVTFRHSGAGPDRSFYVAYDAGKTLYISLAAGAEQRRLVSEPIPPEIRGNMERTLEVRFVGNRLTATLNGSFTVTATDGTVRQGECAMVLHKGALMNKVETLALDTPKATPVDEDFMGMVAAVNASRQAELVADRIRQLNGVQPDLLPTIVAGKVTGLVMRTANPTITDISPVAALKHLTALRTDNNAVRDISCLAGLALEDLSLLGESLTDVSALKSMPLKSLSLRGAPVADFSLLAGKPLERLQLSLCRKLSDISFVKGMPLTYLKIDYTNVRDLSPLAGLPLTEVECNPDIKLDAALLRSVPTLKIFNRKPVAELLPQAPAAP